MTQASSVGVPKGFIPEGLVCPKAIDDEGLEFQGAIPQSPREQVQKNAGLFGGPATE